MPRRRSAFGDTVLTEKRHTATCRSRGKHLPVPGLTVERLEHRCLLASHSLAGIEAATIDPADYTPRMISNPFARDAVSVGEMMARAATRDYVPGELIVALDIPLAKPAARQFADAIHWPGRMGIPEARSIRTLLTTEQAPGSSVSLVRLDLGDHDIFQAMASLDESPDVLWSSPNFVGEGDPRELTPNDPRYAGQYHHPLMQNNLAWDLTLGDSSILIGITDDGFDIDHVDLIDNIYVNAGEIPGDNVDNDLNGYIDDVNGWDFRAGNNDPNPNAPTHDHGTHVAGIAAGRTDNGIGIAGTAGRAKILPLQFYDGQWTAAQINETFTYAADNGAQIVTTSYNIDVWVGDPTFTAGMQYMYDQGVMHFNSAGNNNQLNPPRQSFEQSLLVANTTNTDQRSTSSNYGVGVDISAPGTSIDSTILNNLYGLKTGTSMASPNAAGAAALIWSHHPTWTREQVAAQLMATADNIDAQNPAFVGLLGAGRVNSFRALTETIGAPKVKSLTGIPANGATVTPATISSFVVAFNQIMDPVSVNNIANYDLRSAGPDLVFDTMDDVVFTMNLPDPYRLSTNQLDVNIVGGLLGLGRYRFRLVSDGLQNPFGTGLDGDGNGAGGDHYDSFFDVGMIAVPPSGSTIYSSAITGTIGSAEETDIFTLPLDALQSLTLAVTSAPSLMPSIAVRGPGGALLGQVDGTGPFAILQSVPVATAGTYEISISGLGGSLGNYQITSYLNAAVEEETYTGSGNNTPATSQSLDSAAVQLGTGSARVMNAVGNFSVGDGFESGSLDASWSTYSSDAFGRIRVTGEQGTAAGNFAVLMDRDPSGADTLNEAIWTVNLAGLTNPTLTFFHAEWGDEELAMPLSFVGHANGDGVAISADGVTWRRVFNPTSQTTGQWQLKTVNLATEAAAAGMTLGNNFKIKFQQFDNFPITTDGRGYDEVSISSSSVSDWYQFRLNDGETATLSLTSHASLTDPTSLELYASDGTTLLATGVAAANLGKAIGNYVDTTSNGSADTYYVRTSGTGTAYSLVITRNADFDREANDTTGTAQNISTTGGVLGFVAPGSGVDVFSFDVLTGQVIDVDAYLPGAGPGQFVNRLDTPSGSALNLELLDTTATVVATGVQGLVHAATQTGTYSLRVSSTTQSGEYFVSYALSSDIDGDFNDDGRYDCADINALTNAIVNSGSVALFDLTGDGQLSILDLDAWRAEAGEINLGPGGIYPIGDADLDGVADGADFATWDKHKFTVNSNWCNADFNADGVVDGQDFNLWNENRQVLTLVGEIARMPMSAPRAVQESATDKVFESAEQRKVQPTSVASAKVNSVSLPTTNARRSSIGLPTTKLASDNASVDKVMAKVISKRDYFA